MPFISYAQNFEDVILRRALAKVKKGFYVDVGACFPDLSSVTKSFYDIGWKGINIEPMPDTYNLLKKNRPKDINLNVAISSDVGKSVFYKFEGELGSSSLVPQLAKAQSKRGKPVSKITVSTTTLGNIFKEYVGNRTVHFLKIDVEGFEADTLAGIDLSIYRPWIIVVEAMEPWKQKSTHEAWEPILLNAAYRFAYADGLNRFYVSEEHTELLPAFTYPPNVFDGFVLSGQHLAETTAKNLEQRLEEVQAMEAAQRKQLEEVQAMEAAQRKQLGEVRISALSMAEKLIDQLHSRNKEWAERAVMAPSSMQPHTAFVSQISASDESLQASLIRAAERWQPGRKIDV